MTREIKFRAWDGKEMLHEFSNSSDLNEFLGGGNNGLYKFMQFTGLLDNNGKEIYEGDIVRYENMSYDPSEGDAPYDFSQIEWKDFYWCYAEGCINEVESKDFEIIGNIYENPELLK